MRKGFTIFDTVLFILMSMVSYSTYLQSKESTQQSVTADSIGATMFDIKEAGTQWIHDNSANAMQQMSDGQVVAVPLTGDTGPFSGTTSLFPSNQTPNNYSANLPYGQKLAYLIKKVPATATTPEHLESLISSYGGVNYTNRLLGLTAEKIGVTGGAILNNYKDMNPLPGNIQGTYGSWSYPSSYWSSSGTGGSDYTPKTGHIAMIGNNYGGVVTEYLNRYSTGNIESNSMHTDMDINNYNVTTVNTVNGVTNIPNQNLYLGSTTNANNVVMPRNLTVCDQDHNGCGIVLNTTSSVINDGQGWTSLVTGGNGLYIAGSQYPNMRVETGVYTAPSIGDEINHPSGVIFNYNSTQGVGAHLFQTSMGSGVLTLTGNNGFTGLNIFPTNGAKEADVKILRDRIYGDANGNIIMEVPSQSGGFVAAQHLDGTTSSIAANAVNLGDSTGVAQDGKIYPATYTIGSSGQIIGGPCSPNGRIASSNDGQGTLLTCVDGRWYNQGKQAFNYKVYGGSAAGYGANNTDYTQLAIVVYNMDYWFDKDYGSNSYGQTGVLQVNVNGNYDHPACINKHEERMKKSEIHSYSRRGAYTCAVVLPPHSTIDYSGTLTTECTAHRSHHHHPHHWSDCQDITPWMYIYSSVAP